MGYRRNLRLSALMRQEIEVSAAKRYIKPAVKELCHVYTCHSIEALCRRSPPPDICY